MTHPSKIKGNTGEREVVKIFEKYGLDCERAWGSNGRSLGLPEEVDCLAQGDLRIQVKRRKKIAKWLKLSEVVDSVAVREDRGEFYIILRLEEFCSDYAKFLKWKKEKGNEDG